MSCPPSHCVLFLLAHHLLHVILTQTNECRFTLQALDEARSIARRPMAQSLKDEREEIVVRCYLAKGDADRAVAETAGHANPGTFSFGSSASVSVVKARCCTDWLSEEESDLHRKSFVWVERWRKSVI